MTIYLMQGSDDGTRVDEIEGKLKSTIPELKRVPSLEDIDELAIDGVERSTVVLVAAAPEIANRPKSNRRCRPALAKHFLHRHWRRYFRRRLQAAPSIRKRRLGRRCGTSAGNS